MSEPSTEVTAESLRHIRRVQLRSKRLVDTLLAGAYRSAFKGRGMEFAEVREYQPGDPTRHIDWNVTARMQHPFVKHFEEERELTVMLVVDISGSAHFGSQTRTKAELMAELGGVLAFSAIENNDRIGLILFSDGVDKYIPPKRGVRHAMRVVRELLVQRPYGTKTDMRKALNYLGKVQKRSCICFLISDFLTRGYQHSLRVAAKRYDLIGVRVSDPHERKLPKLGMLQLKDLETGEDCLVDSSDTTTRELFDQRVHERNSKQERMMHQLGAGFIDICTDTPYTQALHGFFRHRQRFGR